MGAQTLNTLFINHLPLNQPFQVVTQYRHLDKKVRWQMPSTCAAFGISYIRPKFASVQSVPAPTWKRGTATAIRPCGSYDSTGLHRARLNGVICNMQMAVFSQS